MRNQLLKDPLFAFAGHTGPQEGWDGCAEDPTWDGDWRAWNEAEPVRSMRAQDRAARRGAARAKGPGGGGRVRAHRQMTQPEQLDLVEWVEVRSESRKRRLAQARALALPRPPRRPRALEVPAPAIAVPRHPLAVMTQTLLEFYLADDAPWREDPEAVGLVLPVAA